MPLGKLSNEKQKSSCLHAKSLQSDSLQSHGLGPPDSSVHGILWAGILEWVAISFSRGSSQPWDWTWVSCIAGRFLTDWATREACWATRKAQKYCWPILRDPLVAQLVKNLPANVGDTGDTRDKGFILGPGRTPGEGNDDLLQYFCLKNALDRGAWWATVHGTAKSQTQLSMHTWLLMVFIFLFHRFPCYQYSNIILYKSLSNRQMLVTTYEPE